MATAWILYEDRDRRAVVAMALVANGYEDTVAFEDAGQLLAHRFGLAPAVAVVDAWTARFDFEAVRSRLAGVPRVILITSADASAAWEWSGARSISEACPLSELGAAVAGALGPASGAKISSGSPRP